MRTNPRVQDIWLRLLAQPKSEQHAPSVGKIEEGYYAAEREVVEPPASPEMAASADLSAITFLIPNLRNTRAVYLNERNSYGLAGEARPRDWAGDLAAPIECGVRHAFAVVDPEILARHVDSSLQASGWKVELVAQDLRVSDGRFTENINLLRLIVQMVLARATFAEAGTHLKAEIRRRFTLDADLFSRFQQRFKGHRPAVFDRYFTAYPECCCVAAGWDYWQVAGRSAQEAFGLLDQGMKELDTFLAMPSDDWLRCLPADCCGRNND